MEEYAVHNLSLFPRRDIRLAACVSGGVRSLTNPEVFLSLRDSLESTQTNFKVFYVLDMNDAYGSRGPTAVDDLHQVLSELPATGFLEFAQPEHLRRQPDCLEDQWNCPLIGMQLDACTQQIEHYELVQGLEFQWILRVRPDMAHHNQVGPIWRYDPNFVHMPACRKWACCNDKFAVIPRRFWQVYQRGYKNSDGSFICGSDSSLLQMGIPSGSTHCGCLQWAYFLNGENGTLQAIFQPQVPMLAGTYFSGLKIQ